MVNHSGIGLVRVNLDLPIWIDKMNIVRGGGPGGSGGSDPPRIGDL